MIEMKHVSKKYFMGDTVVEALRDVSLTIEEGDFVAIMGPSGSGKSTLAHIIGLLDVPTSGSYSINTKETSQLNEDELAILRRDEIGFIFQQFNLLPRLQAIENVALPLFYSKKGEGLEHAQQLLDQVGLGPRSHHRPNELSGGQQQRVAIARSLINRPRVILADEPTGNLDSKSEKEIIEILKALNEQGITIIMITHEEEIGAQAHRLIRMRDGLIHSDERKIALNSKNAMSYSPTASVPQNLFYDIVEHFSEGFHTLRSNRVRSALSMLGILIGVAAVVTMLALGTGAKQAIQEQLSSLGSNLLVLRSGGTRVGGIAQEVGATTRLTLEDAQSIKAQISTTKEAVPNVNSRGQVTYLDNNWSTQMQGTTPAYARIHSAQPVLGRFFTEEENRMRAKVAVIGMTVVKQLFALKNPNANPIGEYIKINKINFQVIGVLPVKGSTGGWRDQDDIIVIPIETAMHRLMGKEFIDAIEVEASTPATVDITQDRLLQHMNSRKKVPLSQQDSAFSVFNMADMQAAMSKSGNTMSSLLAAIAAISLLVGGIGIMNIMLVSVTERTKEIGLRKAIGAKRRDILLQFLAESVVISTIGGFTGILLGYTSSLLLSKLTGWNMTVSMSSVLISFFFSAFIGIVFGIYPSQKAAQLHPIDALRYE